MQTDVVVVGAGAAGLLAAVAARRLGHDVLVVERSGAVGGSTATTDGALWLPANDLMGRAGLPSDTPAEALGYLDALATPVSAVIAGRRAAFTRTAGVVARWLVTSRIALEVVKSLPDCRPEVEGAKAQGRTVRVRSVPRKLDDDWAGKVRGDDGGRTNQGFWGRLANPFTNPG